MQYLYRTIGAWLLLLFYLVEVVQPFGCVTCVFPALNYFCCILVETCCEEDNSEDHDDSDDSDENYEYLKL